MDTLGSVICFPQYKAWEVEDTKADLSLDLAQLQASPSTLVLEGIHQLAFRLGHTHEREGGRKGVEREEERRGEGRGKEGGRRRRKGGEVGEGVTGLVSFQWGREEGKGRVEYPKL